MQKLGQIYWPLGFRGGISKPYPSLRRAKKVCDGASKQARGTSIVRIAQNRSSVRLHCHVVLKHPLLLLTAARRPLFVISLRRLVAGASCARKFRADIRTSYRPPEGLSARRSAGPRGGCGVLCLLHVVCVLYDLHPCPWSYTTRIAAPASPS